MTQPDYSPSADRNKQPILDALLQFLPAQGTALEIASGTGQHLAWFARRLPGWTWQPTEAQVSALAGIQARTVQAGLANVLAPVQLDVCADPWLPNRPGTNAAPTFNLIFCANMLHIAPWSACAALMRGSARHLAAGGVLVTYGPYLEADACASATPDGASAGARTCSAKPGTPACACPHGMPCPPTICCWCGSRTRQSLPPSCFCF
jgi:SAM-dependent methyltransferase